MNYGQLKKQVLQLMFTESLAGEPIPDTYNNQADYIRAIPGLASDGMMYIAMTVKRIPAMKPLSQLKREDFGTHWLYTLPGSCWRMHNGGLIWPRKLYADEYTYERFHGYKMYANKKLMIPKNTPGLDSMIVEYYRYPNGIDEETSDDTELDNTPDTHYALPYYIASQLVMYDDAFRYSAFWNAFETRLSRLSEPVTTEFAPLEEAYNGFYIPGV